MDGEHILFRAVVRRGRHAVLLFSMYSQEILTLGQVTGPLSSPEYASHLPRAGEYRERAPGCALRVWLQWRVFVSGVRICDGLSACPELTPPMCRRSIPGAKESGLWCLPLRQTVSTTSSTSVSVRVIMVGAHPCAAIFLMPSVQLLLLLSCSTGRSPRTPPWRHHQVRVL